MLFIEDTMNAKSAHVVLLTGIFLLMLMDMASAVKCYICSWNPRDYDNDTCTTDNFNPQRTRTDECDAGCETVIMRDSNGDLEMFYRNCYTNGNYIYSKEMKRVNNEEKYKCSSRLCNAGTRIQLAFLPVLLCGSVIITLCLTVLM
ncbi:uncharacterized protein LOC126469881 isoform X2 [Schistocerca serialis cubense]|uniref:uncharacterized protein LOC126469881 isoform X2 n=1 Tax=Schistocerca serialis cubense TaxID=2023355 RepID=UPI00214E21ED|nr:uncharacterized protein LOC126469881 isoform X2 [Schistocerca serialis cubense]